MSIMLTSFAPAQDAKMAGKKPAAARKMPPRDPKTGRFMKQADYDAKYGKGAPAKTMPARDPKTGRFMKKDTAPKKMGMMGKMKDKMGAMKAKMGKKKDDKMAGKK